MNWVRTAAVSPDRSEIYIRVMFEAKPILPGTVEWKPWPNSGGF